MRSQDGRLLIGVQDVAINGAQLLGLDHGAASELFRNQKTDLSHGLLMARYRMRSDVPLFNFQPAQPRDDRQRKRQVGRSITALWLFEVESEALEVMVIL